MKVGIVSDHRGFKLKGILVDYLKKKGFEVFDYGTDSEQSTDYPKYGFLIGEKVSTGEVEYGIAICGSGIGISIACNKVKGIRCAKVSSIHEAYYTRVDNNSNIIALSGDVPPFKAKKIVYKFLSTEFSNIERHLNRINMISEYERNR